MFKTYYSLVKPGIVYSNAMMAAAGFLLASKWHFSIVKFLAVIVGTSLVVACGCVFNNYIDRGIDKQMARTKRRALVTGRVPVRNAIIYGAALGSIGFAALILYTNILTVMVGTTGLFFYVVVYGVAKRRTIHGTLVGTISGATPPVAGYVAATDRLDAGALILFLILVCWQMPHFYAIATYRRADYAAAGLPVWPVKKSLHSTKLQMIGYIIAFGVAIALLSVFGYTGFTFLLVMGLLSLYWLRLGLKGLKATDNSRWARQLFGYSLLVVLSLSVMLAVGPLLP